MSKPNLDDKLRKEYNTLFKTCQTNPGKDAAVQQIVNAITASQARYENVSSSTGVPWQVIAAIHSMEAGLRFDQHLHNGDPLSARTVQVPAGRPVSGSPPFTWEASAMDALAYDGMTTWSDWTLSGSLYKLEGYNGWGYRSHGINTPYLWSYCQHYTQGKYVADGKWSDTAVSKQCGAALILKALGYAGTDSPGGGGAPPPVAAVAGNLVAPDSTDYPGQIIKKGLMDSPQVLLVQQRLNARGFGPVGEDGDFGQETENAVRQFQAQSTATDGSALTIDGEVGALTWAALFGKDTVPSATPKDAPTELLRKVLAVAKTQIGVSEQPPGSNAGPEVEAYLKSAGASKGEPWCMSFVYWCFQQASTQLGIPNPCVKTAGVHDHWNRAVAAGARRIGVQDAAANPAMVFPGMVFCIDTGGGNGHTGFVTHVDGGNIDTIEGNTNNAQGREGIAVMSHTRKINTISLGFVDYSKF